MKKKIQTINNLLSNTHNSKSEYLAIIEDPLQTFFFPHVKPKQNFVKEYINRVVYPIYVILVEKDKDKGKDIDDLFYILS